MKMKLTTCEKRALAMCEALKRNDGGSFSVVWKKSAMYGHNPVIDYGDGKCTNVSGCGYDKLSAALSQALCFLLPDDQRGGMSGAGENTVISRMAENGWKLKKVASGKAFDSYTITKL